MEKKYDLVVIGGGPGGYVAAIRASQLGKKVAVIEKESLGGVCLNWGCIPTKSLLKNAQIFDLIKKSKNYGIEISDYKVNWSKIIQRSRNISKRLSKGIEYLMNKNKIDHFAGFANLIDKNTIEIDSKNGKHKLNSDFIILATGTVQRNLPGIEIDQKFIISSKEAMVLEKIPKDLVIVGAGAIGIEFAHLYNTFGSNVTIIEAMDTILPNEDHEISKELTAIFKKRKINVITGSRIDSINKQANNIVLKIDGKELVADKLLIAVGVSGNIENIGVEKVGIKTENNFIKTDNYMKTNIDNIYAIGDVSGPPLLAHVASAEGIVAVEHLCGLNPQEMKYHNIPSCTYCEPEIASVGLTEKEAESQGYKLKIGKFPFRALGKSLADGNHDGFVKIIYDSKYGELLGCHIIGHEASNLITEVGLARNLETTYYEVLKTIHPHPTLSEAIHEATADAFNEAIHI